ncbi:A-factor biosynthesis protein [Streptomyces sp. YC537]|uniref:A-factor biosynthesis protein n=2 Tax=Streptomyces boluensis TaxID=1775135 RepID=A0A964UJR2_9ACTN|nr:A-factor biosynthesis protein [Streptomyces boluensis]
MRRSGPDTFTFAVRWPAVRGAGRYDPRILAQTIRQTGLFLAHAEYGVPTSHQTLLNRLDFTVSPNLFDGSTELLDVEVSLTKPNGRSASTLMMAFRIHRDGTTVATADADFGWISPGAYRRVRGVYATVDWGDWSLPAPVAPEFVGRAAPTDVVLSPGDRPNHWQLRNDPANTLLFDHPVDHVPGLALLEAAEQAAHAVLSPTPFETTEIQTAFERYVEFDRPCWIEAELLTEPDADRFAVLVTGTQGEGPAFLVKLSGRRP